MDQVPHLQERGNALDAFILLISMRFPPLAGVAVMVYTGDQRAPGRLNAVSTHHRGMLLCLCPRCGRLDRHPPLSGSAYRDWIDFAERVERASICTQCHYRVRLRMYRQAVFQIERMSPVRQSLYMEPGRCLQCGEVVQALQSHQPFLCAALPPSHAPSPVWADESSSDSS